jgi:hypothetical protein
LAGVNGIKNHIVFNFLLMKWQLHITYEDAECFVSLAVTVTLDMTSINYVS